MKTTEKSASSNPRRAVIGSLLVASLAIAYGYAFFQATPERTEVLLAALRPEDVVALWTATGFSIADRFAAWIMVALYLLSAYSLGRIAMRGQLHKFAGVVETFAIATSLGLGIGSTLTMLLGLAGLLEATWLFWSLLLAPMLAWAWIVACEKRQSVACDSAEVNTNDKPRWWLMSGFALAIFVYLVAGTLPPTDFDVREYHLQAPKEWSEAGRITFLPYNVYASMPLGAEMHVVAMQSLLRGLTTAWYAALVGKAIIALFAPLTAMVLYSAGKRFYSPGAGALAAALYLSFPWIAHVSFNGLNDGVLAHYLFCAMFVLLVSRDSGLLAGAFAGCAAATKYPGLVFALPIVCVLLVYLHWNDKRLITRQVAGLLLGFALVAGPWYAKNAIFAGNPVYPLAGSIFPTAERSPERVAQWERAHQVPRDQQGRRYAAAELASSALHVGLRSEWLSPIAWPLVLIGLVAACRRRETKVFLWAATWIFAVWWCATHRIDRFWLPTVPLLVMIAGGCVEWSPDIVYRRARIGIVGLGVLLSSLFVVVPVIRQDGTSHLISNPFWFSDLTKLTRELTPGPHREVNALCKADEAVLLVGDATPWDISVPVLYNTCFDESIFERLTSGQSRDECRAKLASLRIRYVLVDWNEIARYRSPGNYGFTGYVQPEVFARLVSEGVLTKVAISPENESPGVDLYQVH